MIKMTKFGEIVFIRCTLDANKKDGFGRTLPEKYLGKVLEVKRTGSKTWQPLKYDEKGYKHNFYPCHVVEVYIKEKNPEYFL